jgi:protein-tyrosine phosphatase
MKILFVCIGNICRSPIAEGVLTSLIRTNQLNWICSSAATHAYHINERPHQFSQQICMTNNIDISNQKSKRICVEDFKNYDIIYALATDIYENLIKSCPIKYKHKIKILMNELEPKTNKSIKDPYYGMLEDYKNVYIQIENCCKQIIINYN